MVAPGGTLVVIALARADGEEAGPWPPWPITRAEVEAFTATGLAPVKIEEVADAGQEPPGRRWLAEFRRPGSSDRGAARRRFLASRPEVTG